MVAVVRLSILGSGSGGNCTVISTTRTTLMLDAGFSRRETRRRMAVAGLTGPVHAVLVSHEHQDHVQGLRLLAAEFAAPVYGNAGTRAALGPEAGRVTRWESFCSGTPFTIGDIEVTPVPVPHDAAEPVAFTFRCEGVKLGFVTDLGGLTPTVEAALEGCDGLVFEANHDLEMLKTGPYAWALKERVLSPLGHLSNDAMAAYLARAFDGAAAHLVLAHLSAQNNVPALALLAAERGLEGRRQRPRVSVAAQDAPLPALFF
ncbi:MAG: MBL fold metallo-hydrolase [Terriglobales bacterium]